MFTTILILKIKNKKDPPPEPPPQKILKKKKKKKKKSTQNSLKTWWMCSFARNLALIRLTVSEKTAYADGRMEDERPRHLYHSMRLKFGSHFQETGLLSKLLYWLIKVSEKSSRNCTCTLFLQHGLKIELIFTLLTAVSDIRADFQCCRSRHETWHLKKSSWSCIWILFESDLYGQRFSEIQANF